MQTDYNVEFSQITIVFESLLSPLLQDLTDDTLAFTGPKLYKLSGSLTEDFPTPLSSQGCNMLVPLKLLLLLFPIFSSHTQIYIPEYIKPLK